MWCAEESLRGVCLCECNSVCLCVCEVWRACVVMSTLYGAVVRGPWGWKLPPTTPGGSPAQPGGGGRWGSGRPGSQEARTSGRDRHLVPRFAK